MLYSVLLRLVALLPRASAERLSGDGRFQVLLNGLRARLGECNSAMLVRLAHCAASLRTAEAFELLEEVEKESTHGF